MDFQHWLRLVGCVESPLPKWFDPDSDAWACWGLLYDSVIDKSEGMPLCACIAVCKSVVPATKLLYTHPDTSTATGEIGIALEAMNEVTAHPNFYRSDVRCEVLHAALAFASLGTGPHSGTASEHARLPTLLNVLGRHRYGEVRVPALSSEAVASCLPLC